MSKVVENRAAIQHVHGPIHCSDDSIVIIEETQATPQVSLDDISSKIGVIYALVISLRDLG